MEKLLAKITNTGFISRREYMDMVRANPKLVFNVSPQMLTTFPSPTMVQEVMEELTEKIATNKARGVGIVIGEERALQISKLISRIEGFRDSVLPSYETIKSADLTNFKLLAYHRDGSVVFNDRLLSDVFGEREVLLSRSKRKEDTARYLSTLTIATNTIFFSMLRYADSKAFTTRINFESVTLIEAIFNIKNVDINQLINNVIAILRVEMVSLQPSIDLNYVETLFSNETVNIFKLLASILEL